MADRPNCDRIFGRIVVVVFDRILTDRIVVAGADREPQLQAIEHDPVRVTMNDGPSYDIDNLRDVSVDSTTCYLMKRGADGRYRTIWLALVCMTKVEQLSIASQSWGRPCFQQQWRVSIYGQW